MALRDKSITKPGTGLNPVATWPSGAQPGDYAIAAYYEETVQQVDIAPPTGWTERAGVTLTADGMVIKIYDLDGGVGGSPPSTTWTANNSGSAKTIYIFVFSGRDLTAPRTFVQPTTHDSSTASPASLAMTGDTAAAGDDLISFVAIDKFVETDTWDTDWSGTGLTEQYDDDNSWIASTVATQDNHAGGATGTITPVATRTSGSNNTGWWGVIVGIKSSGPATGPTITAQPVSQHLPVNGKLDLSVAASPTGGGTLTYQWKKGGVNVSVGTGGTTSNYVLDGVGLTDDLSSFTCAVTETGGTNDGTATSTAATLRVGIIYLASGGPAYSTAGGSTVAPPYPSVAGGIQAGDQLVCFVALKPPTASPNTGTVTTPTTGGTWNRPAERTAANDGNTGGYATTIAADTGNVGAFSFDILASGGETGTMSISLGGTGGTGNAASVAWAVMLAFRKPPGTAWSTVVGSTGKRTQNTTPSAGVVSESMAADPGVTSGDYVVFMMGIPTDANGGATWSSEAVTQTGVTYETAVETDEPFTSNGDDIGGFVAITRALTGTSSAAPVVGATKGGTTTNARGPIILLRLRTVGLSMLALMPWQRRNRNPAYFNM